LYRVVGSNESTELLIDADIAGKLIIGRKYNLKNGLTAFETYLCWTMLGKLPRKVKRSEAAVTISTMFVQEANLCDLWRLDVIGINNLIKKTVKSTRDERTREFLINTARINADSRYKINYRGWKIMRLSPVIIKSRVVDLEKCLDKLTTQNLFGAYNVFKEWLRRYYQVNTDQS